MLETYLNKEPALQRPERAGNDASGRAGNDTPERAGNDASERAGNDVSERAGNDASERAGNDTPERAGNDASERAGNDANEEAGADSVGHSRCRRLSEGGLWVVCGVPGARAKTHDLREGRAGGAYARVSDLGRTLTALIRSVV